MLQSWLFLALANSEEARDIHIQHGRKLTKRQHSYETFHNHTHHKRTTLEPNTPGSTQQNSNSKSKLNESQEATEDWDPTQQYNQESSKETLDNVGELLNKASHMCPCPEHKAGSQELSLTPEGSHEDLPVGAYTFLYPFRQSSLSSRLQQVSK